MKISHMYFGNIRKNNIIIRAIVANIIVYQKTISPDHGMLQNFYRTQHCRFFPSCSDYAVQSLRQYGLMKGIMLSLKRIIRCNPFCAGGYDPVRVQ